MHIANGLLDSTSCLISSGMAATGLAFAAQQARRQMTRDTAGLAVTVRTTLLAGQMVDIAAGAHFSGHLVGGALAAILLGPALALVVMAAVLSIQCFALGDGGVTALGANFLSLGITSVLVGHVVWQSLRKRTSNWLAAGAASWLSVVAASIVCTLTLATSGIGGTAFAGGMLLNHGMIGLVEVSLTLGVLGLLAIVRTENRWKALATVSVLFAAALPFSSMRPDGLEAAMASVGSVNPLIAWSTVAFAALAAGITLNHIRSVNPAKRRR